MGQEVEVKVNTHFFDVSLRTFSLVMVLESLRIESLCPIANMTTPKYSVQTMSSSFQLISLGRSIRFAIVP